MVSVAKFLIRPVATLDKFSIIAAVIFWLLLRNCISTQAFRCQSCFAGCRTFDDCDCEGDENSTCEAGYCYAKLEYFTDDGVSAIQKGCTNEASTSFLGCQYASDDRSIACFCSGDLCNSALNLSQFETPELPLVTCCECNEDETGDEMCFPQNCTRNCTGNYCYLDMVANAQGCGWGHPQLFHFLRAQKYRRWEQELTCAEYYDNYRNYMSGCTCSSHFCNVVTDVEQLSTRRRTQIEQKNNHFCYSLYAHSETAFGAEVYRHASLCPSYFCFISWTSVEVVFDPVEEDDDTIMDVGDMGSGEGDYPDKRQNSDYAMALRRNSLPSLRSAYEISAGCLLVDDEKKVQIGCTTEWSQSERSPLTKHCICSEKLCNDFHLIDDSYTSEAAQEGHRPPFRHGSLSSFGPTGATSTSETTSTETTTETTTEYDGYLSQEKDYTPEGDLTPEKDLIPEADVSPSTSPPPTPASVDETLVPVTSAFVTSPITEPSSEEKTSPPVATTTKASSHEQITEVPLRPPKGHFRIGQTSSAKVYNGICFTLQLVVVVCTLLSTARTAA